MAGVTAVAVGVATGRGRAVLVAEEDEADAHGAEAEEGDRRGAQRDGLRVLVDLGHALGGGEVDVDAAAEGEDHADRLRADRVQGDDDDAAEEHREAAHEVEDERLGRLQGALVGVGQDEIVGELLRELVVDGREGDGPGDGAGAVPEGGADEETVAQVVHEVAQQD